MQLAAKSCLLWASFLLQSLKDNFVSSLSLLKHMKAKEERTFFLEDDVNYN